MLILKIMVRAALLLLLSAGSVLAQSAPNLITGQVPTAVQWNSYFAAKQDTLGYQPVNKAGDVMSGKLTTASSSTTRAGISLLPGVAPTSPVNGDMWTTTAGVFAQINGTTVGPFAASATPTGAALTRVSDTNVVLTLGGSPTNALLNAASITASWSGTLAASRGGFGADVSASSGVPLFASGVSTFTSTTGSGNFVRATSATLTTPTLTSASASALTVTGSFTATGLVTNASLANPSTTVNGTTCTLGSTCTITATAASVTVGTTTIASGTTTRILYDNAGTLGEYTISGSGTTVAMNTAPVITGGSHVALTSLGIRSTAASFDILLASAEAISANRTITFQVNNVNRLVNIGGDLQFTGATNLPVIVQGDIWYGAAAGVMGALAKDTGTSRFVKNSGTSNNPAWAQPAASDLSNGTTGSGAVVLAASPTLSGTIAGSITLSGNNTYSGTALFTGGVPSLANGNAAIAASATKGGLFTGKGSTSDVTVQNGAGSDVCTIATGTTTINCATLTLTNRLGSAYVTIATSSVLGIVQCDGTTITCTAGVITAIGAAATSISVGTTTIASGTASNILYNNAGVLGNATIASFLTAGSAITITGTTNATIAASAKLLPGTATNDAASVGNLGEYASASVNGGSGVSLSSGTSANFTQVSLTAGDWDVGATLCFRPGATTNVTILQGSVSSTTGAIDFGTGNYVQIASTGTVLQNDNCFVAPVQRISLAGTSNIFLVGAGTFSVSTLSGYGLIRARRVR